MKGSVNLPYHTVLNKPLALSNVAALGLMLSCGKVTGLLAL